jgi:hypothetical protein
MISKGTFPEMEPGSGSYEVLLLEAVTEMFDHFALEYAKRHPAPGIDDSLFEGGDLTGDEVDYEDALMAENDRSEDDGLAYLDSLVGSDSLLREDTLFRALLSDGALSQRMLFLSQLMLLVTVIPLFQMIPLSPGILSDHALLPNNAPVPDENPGCCCPRRL